MQAQAPLLPYADVSHLVSAPRGRSQLQHYIGIFLCARIYTRTDRLEPIGMCRIKRPESGQVVHLARATPETTL